MSNLFHTKKLKKNAPAILRFCIQLIFFVTMPAAFTSAFSGVKYIFTQLGSSQVLEATAFVWALIALCAYTAVFGRFFCGFACAFGSLGDWIYAIGQWVQKKIKKKLPQIPLPARKVLNRVKYVVMVLVIVGCFTGVYSALSGWSPWDVFSMLTALQLRISGYGLGLVLLILIVVGMVFQERFFCRFLCPMGAVFSLLPMFPVFSLHRSRENCLPKCSACERKCPADLELPDIGKTPVSADCFQCQKCTNVCPKSNVSCGITKIRGNEWWWIVLRAVILFGVCAVAGI